MGVKFYERKWDYFHLFTNYFILESMFFDLEEGGGAFSFLSSLTLPLGPIRAFDGSLELPVKVFS